MRTFILAKEGFATVFVLFILTIGAALCDLEFLAAILFFALIYTLWFFRNPERIPSERDSLSIIAPIDGKIVSIEGEGDFVKIAIRTGVFDARPIRSPIQARSFSLSIAHGIAGAKDYLKQIETIALDQKVLIALEPCYKPSRFYKPKNGSYLGERLGFFYGGTAILAAPKECDVKVAIGAKVKAGESAIGFIRS
ncbi:MAG: hypothetical protein LBQ52_09660 [Helicobacteraceae bacterium]|jgi:phosphatidylserine decarboxylase|nr:hypothetical protein [Helicobacteraceae bacterium]